MVTYRTLICRDSKYSNPPSSYNTEPECDNSPYQIHYDVKLNIFLKKGVAIKNLLWIVFMKECLLIHI